jgi:sarcosine oxidase
VEANRIPLLWFEPREGEGPETFQIERFPVFYRELAEGQRLWGHGNFEGTEIKVGPVGDPTRDRTTVADLVDRGVSPADWDYVTSMTRDALPGLAATPSKVQPCMTTTTPDGQFLVGRLHGSRTLIAGGCNAHGFKHSGAIGELLAREAVGEDPPLDARFIDPNRFSVAS